MVRAAGGGATGGTATALGGGCSSTGREPAGLRTALRGVGTHLWFAGSSDLLIRHRSVAATAQL